jgi:hypothetical protein
VCVFTDLLKKYLTSDFARTCGATVAEMSSSPSERMMRTLPSFAAEGSESDDAPARSQSASFLLSSSASCASRAASH